MSASSPRNNWLCLLLAACVQFASLPLPAHASVPTGPHQRGVSAHSAVAVVPQKLSEGDKSPSGPQSGGLIISEFRLRGPNGPNDEFVELYNNSAAPLTVNTTDGSSGFSVAASDGIVRFIIPNGTVIPARGHYLGVNSEGYSLGAQATSDISYTADIADNAGIALFRTAEAANFTPANRLDAVGAVSESDALYKEGVGYPEVWPESVSHSLYRDLSGGTPKDTDDNAADFLSTTRDGLSDGAGGKLGGPSPMSLRGGGIRPAACSSLSFTRTDFAAGTQPQSVAIGDFNGDGNSDLAVANQSSNNVSILLGTGTGSFSAATNFAVGTAPQSVVIGDFNGDGKSDLAVANSNSSSVSILLGTGTGSFSAATNFAVGTTPLSVAIGDFNGDSNSDLVATNFNSDNVSILLGTGTGSFGAATNFVAGTAPQSVVIRDFNGDSNSDLAVANQSSNNISILFGTGTGNFGAATNFAVGTTPVSVAIGDFNGDGNSDLATANYTSNNVSILLGTGTGSFGAATNFVAGAGPRAIAIGDFNGDSKSDLAVASQQSSNASILLGTGTGSFGAATNFAVGDTPQSVAIGDFNGDSKSDLATANFSVGNISILLNSCVDSALSVSNTNDSGAGSLRQAILDANATTGTQTITFNIGSGLQTINLLSPLPTITDPIIIDGTTQPGFSGTPLIEINGAGAGATGCFVILGGSSTIRGLVLNRFSGTVIHIQTGGGNTIQGNYIGTNAAGTAALANSVGAIFITGSNNNLIGGTTAAARNVIAGNGNGVSMVNGSTGNQVQGNYIGTNAAGTAVINNSGTGVVINSASNNVIGGTAAGARNLISGNGGYGVFLFNGASSNLVQGNYVGTDVNGTAPLANSAGGVAITASSNNTVGGTAAGAGNLISGHTNADVGILDASSSNTVQGNYIGTNAAGTAAIAASGGTGVFIRDSANDLIGGTTPAARNIISGKFTGISITNSGATGNQVQGNYIGTNAAGTAALANSGDGIFILGGANNNTIGGTTAAARNIISGNNGNGLSFRDTGTSNNTVAGNYIGTDVTGTAAIANQQSGVVFGNNAVTNTVGGTAAGAGNVISGNLGDGVNTGLYGGGPGGSITIQGNLIGVSANGTAALGNGGFGIQVNSTPNNLIGGTAAGARNVISGNNFGGVIVGGSTASGNAIQGNYIGTDPSGTVALANNVFGVHISDAPNNLIGGTTAAARNIISGNTGIAANGTGHGIQIDGSNATGNLVQGNYVGIDVSGTTAVPNVRSGIFIFSGATSNTVGGAAAGARNVISGNSVRALNGNLDLAGIDIQGSGNTVSGNYIGTNATGTAAIPNGSGVSFSGSNNTATNNLISGNSQQGISVSNGSGNAILSNSIFSNGGNGISLQNGANGGQPAPVITSAFNVGSTTAIQGTLTGIANTNYTVQFFANDACSLSGLGEGQSFIGSISVTTNAGGSAALSFQSNTAVGQVITATATSAANNTSPFSICRQVVAQGLTISGRATDAANNGLAGVNVTLSGTLSQVVQTDAAGNYSFTVPAGGNYTVIATSPYYVFAQPRADFTGLSSNQTVNFVALAQATPTPTPPLTDDFGGNQRDPNKWNLGTLSQPAAAVDPQVSVTQQNGQLTITPLANAAGQHYNGYVSVQAFDFTGAQANVEVPQIAGGGAQTVFGLGSDNQNNYRFTVMTLGQAASAGLVSMERFRAHWGPLDAVMLVLVFQVRIAGVVTQEVIPYDPTAHRFWRFRHDAPVNALLFETSPDNSAFTERYRKVLDKNVSALAVELTAGTAAPTSSSGSAVFDNLSLVTSSVQFSLTNLTVREDAVRATITVSRSGNVAGSPATLTYATVDNPAAVRCDNTTTLPGVAFARCDYATTVDTLTFAAGETTKTFSVSIIDDSFVEGDETFTLILRAATGASLGAPGLINVTITDNDQPGQPNPVFTSPFFIRQHYLDFLAREPDAGGFNAYLNLLNNCADVNNVDPNSPSAACDRITVSGAFFGSPEFKDKGVYTIVFYRAALNRLPKYSEFAQDLRAVTGRTGAEAAAKRAAFAVDFAARPEFTALYPATMTNAAYVDALLGRYSLAQLTAPDPQNPDGAMKVTLTRADLVNGLSANTLTRAQVLRAVVQSDQVGLNAEALNAFVAAQYYGYLRRTPDTPGFNAWVNYLTMHPGDFRTMVNGFMNSQEYRLRFGNLNQ